MRIVIADPIFQTQIFIVVFVIALFLTIRKNPPLHFDNSLSEEIKGFAILAIIFSHIGYFLTHNQNFLFPLSVDAGVGVNLFLLLSGYGLTKSALKKKLSIMDFYKKRLSKLFVPFWIVISCFFVLEILFLHKSFFLTDYFQSYLGWFPKSNIFGDLDSPLWYFSIILFYYLLFPLIFIKKNPLFSALIVLLITLILIRLPLPVTEDNLKLYRIHIFSFPIGIFLASPTVFLKLKNFLIPKFNLLLYTITAICFAIFCYFSIFSGVGHGEISEQFWSVICALLILVVFILKAFRIKLFQFIGKYSFEIYLIHWPILYYFEHFYKILPGSIATIFYLIEFLVLGVILQKMANFIFQNIKFLTSKPFAN